MKPLPASNRNFFGWLGRNADLAFAFGLFGIIVLLVLPISPFFLDLLLAMSIGMSLLVLLIIIYVEDPAEFTVFPTMLLAVTLFRLGLNVASTRLILLDGFAGHVIEAFGHFVVQSNYIVGSVVFFILVIINFIVITKGAGRIAEVAARFTLDAMPGKQMAIDAELNAGIITEAQATQRRSKIQKEADFYGAMDGASKFVRGDAIAGILITVINVIGGIAIGIFQKKISWEQALQKYTLLSIGDGLVAQVPALIVSISAGILITRTSEGSHLGAHMGRQLMVYPRALFVASLMLLIFGLLPGMPPTPFLLLAAGVFAAYKFLLKSEETKKSDARAKAQEGQAIEAGSARAQAKDFKELIRTDPFSVELGYGLLGLTDKGAGGDLLERVAGVRQKFARELGLILPAIAVRDNIELQSNEYALMLRDKQVGRSTLYPGQWMAMNTHSTAPLNVKGIETKEPVFGLNAIWVNAEERPRAEMQGYAVVDAASVLITHLTESVRDLAHLLLEREDVQKLLDMVKEKHPTLLAELLPDLVSVGLIQRILQQLLKEGISIKNLPLILETIADWAPVTKNPDELTEQVRKRLSVYFISSYEAPGQEVIKALTLEPSLEQTLVKRIQKDKVEISLLMEPSLTGHLIRQFTDHFKRMADEGLHQILVVTTELRLPLRRFFEASFPKMVVLSYQELPAQAHVQSCGTIVPAAT